MVGKGTGLDYRPTTIYKTPEGRSYAKSNRVYLSSSAKAKSTMHELGHVLEHSDPNVREKALAFYDKRTAGEKSEWLGDDYDKGEFTKRDRFLNPYMGKDYAHHATEIVSMGMEYYWDDPAKLAREDPEYFDFIFDLLRGR